MDILLFGLVVNDIVKYGLSHLRKVQDDPFFLGVVTGISLCLGVYYTRDYLSIRYKWSYSKEKN